jgi:hypothetical protein
VGARSFTNDRQGYRIVKVVAALASFEISIRVWDASLACDRREQSRGVSWLQPDTAMRTGPPTRDNERMPRISNPREKKIAGIGKIRLALSSIILDCGGRTPAAAWSAGSSNCDWRCVSADAESVLRLGHIE